MPLEYRKLGRTDFYVSSIGLGCVTFGREIDRTTSLAVLDRALARGINLLDTAAVYGNGASEEVIGKWLEDRRVRDQVLLATKVSGRLTRQNVLQSIDGSLRRLGVQYVDLLQAHEWDPRTPLEETLAAMDSLVRQGKVRYLGCSNWQASQIQQAMLLAEEHNWAVLKSVQPIYNLVDRAIETELLPLCAQQEVGVISYSPLGAGFLTGKYSRGGIVPKGTRFDVKPGHQRIYFTDHGFRVVEELREIAARAGRSMTDLAIGWVLRRPKVTSVLVGARHPDHVNQAIGAMDVPWDDGIDAELDRLSTVQSRG